MFRLIAIACLAGYLLIAPGCGAVGLPTEPTPLATGVVLYEHANFGGSSAHVTVDISNLSKYTGPCEHDDGESVSRDWNDCVSSVKVAPGWRATIYRDTGFRDDFLEVTADVPNLQLVMGDCPRQGLNDCVSSVRVRQEP
jgi:hypothetical protein